MKDAAIEKIKRMDKNIMDAVLVPNLQIAGSNSTPALEYPNTLSATSIPRFKALSNRCAYRFVMATVLCPSRFCKVKISTSPELANLEANVWRRSCALMLNVKAPEPGPLNMPRVKETSQEQVR